MNLEVYEVDMFSVLLHIKVCKMKNTNLKVLLIPISDVKRTVSENEFPEQVSVLMSFNFEAFYIIHY